MKIYTTSRYTEDLSKFTDEELQSFGIYDRAYAKLPISLDKFEFYLNADGYATVSFGVKSHKYLDVYYNTSTNLRYNNDLKEVPFYPKGISIETQEKFRHKTELMMLPVSRLMVWLEPDNKEEAEILNGVACILYSNWHYDMMIVPFDKFNPKENTNDNIVGDLDDDLLYTKDIFNDI
jgi:hypothetical protein